MQTKPSIPSGWTKLKLGEIGKTVSGLSGKTKVDFGHGSPYVTYKNVYFNAFTDLGIHESVAIRDGENQAKLKQYDILFTTSSENPSEVGMSSVLLDAPQDSLYLNSFCFGFRLNDSNLLDPLFTGYLFRGPSFRKHMKSSAKGTTRFNLSKGDFLDTEIYIPTIESQKHIAQILKQTDVAIMTTQKIIDQTSLLRLALLRKLFTQGIEHTGYKETELGNLPSQWSTIKLDEVAKRGSGHTPNKKKPEYYNGGIKWVSLADTSKFDNGVIDDTKYKISQLGIDNSSAVLHSKGTVLLSRDAGVGKSSVMNDDMAVSQHFMVWQCSEKLYNWYLYYYLQFKKKEFERIAVGSTIKTIGLAYFKDMLIPLPPIAEQRAIADTLLSIDEKIRFNKGLKLRQEQLKSGLMQDLLSGKVKV